MSKVEKVEISTRSIVKTILIVVLFLVAWKIRFILVALFFAYILMIGFAQLADWLNAKGLSKTASAVWAYLILIFTLGAILFVIVPPLLIQVRNFVEQLPEYVRNLNNLYSTNTLFGIKTTDLTNILSTQAESFITGSFNIIVNTFSVLLNFFTVAVLSFYMLIERDRIKNNLFHLLPTLPKERVTRLAHEIEKQVGGWLKGELLLMFIVFCASYVGLTLLQVDYALPLALLSGLLEIVPVFGPILSAVPAVIITFPVSPLLSLGVILLYLLVQQIENNFLVPKVMQGVVGINPLLTIIALLIGAELFGVIGVIMSVPLVAIIQVIISDEIKQRKLH